MLILGKSSSPSLSSESVHRTSLQDREVKPWCRRCVSLCESAKCPDCRARCHHHETSELCGCRGLPSQAAAAGRCGHTSGHTDNTETHWKTSPIDISVHEIHVECFMALTTLHSPEGMGSWLFHLAQAPSPSHRANTGKCLLHHQPELCEHTPVNAHPNKQTNKLLVLSPTLAKPVTPGYVHWLWLGWSSLSAVAAQVLLCWGLCPRQG